MSHAAPDHPEVQEHLLAVEVDATQVPYLQTGLQIPEENMRTQREGEEQRACLTGRTRPDRSALARVGRSAGSAVSTSSRANG
jgi:hypothetical protein